MLATSLLRFAVLGLLFLLDKYVLAFTQLPRKSPINSVAFNDKLVLHARKRGHENHSPRSDVNEKKFMGHSSHLDFAAHIHEISTQGDFTSYLKSAAQRKIVLSPSDRHALAKELLLRLPDFSVPNFTSILWSLGALKLPIRSKDMLDVCDMIIERLDSSRDVLTSSDISMALLGLARLGLGCQTVAKDSFLEALPRTMNLMDDQQVANVVWSMGKIGTHWDTLPIRIQKGVAGAIVRTIPKMSPLGVANTIHGLSNQRAKWENLPAPLRASIHFGLERTMKNMKEQEVSNCISGLGRLGAEWSDLSPHIRTLLENAFLRTLEELCPKGLAMSVHGMGRMNADFPSLPANFRSSIMAAIHRIAPSVNAQEVANILYGLGKMGTLISVSEAEKVASDGEFSCKLADDELEEVDNCHVGEDSQAGTELVALGMTLKARIGILDALTREAWRMTAQGVSNSCWGLMLMGALWDEDLTPSSKDAIIAAVTREAVRMDEQGIGNTVYAFGRMGFLWQDTSSELRRELLAAVDARSDLMAPAGVVMTLLGFGRMHLSWNRMPISLRSALTRASCRVLRVASDHTVSSLVHALAAVGANWEQMGASLQTAVRESIARSHLDHHHKNQSRQGTVQRKVEVQDVMSMSVSLPGSVTPKSNETSTGISSSDTQRRINHRVKVGISSLSVPSSSSRNGPKAGPDAVKERAVPVSLSSLLQMKSSRAAAEVLLSPKPLPPSELAAIQSMFSPPNVQTKQQLLNQLLSAAEAAAVAAESNPTDFIDESKDINSPATATSAITLVLPQGPAKVSSAGTHNQSYRAAPAHASKKNVEVGFSTSSSKKLKSRKRREELFVEIGVVSGKEKRGENRDRASLYSCARGNHLVYSLGQMGACWEHLGSSTRATLCNSLLESLPAMDEHAVVTSLHGLTSLGVKWRDLLPDVQLKFTEAIQRVSPDMGEQGVAVAYISLAKLEVCWAEDLSESVKTSLRQAISQQAHIGEHALSSLLYGLGKLSRKWDDLHPSVRQTLKEAIVVCHLNDRCTPQGVANSLYGLAQMQTSWSQLSSSVRRALILEAMKAAPSATETQLSNIISGLSKMGVTWDTLSADARSLFQRHLIALTRTMNEQHLSNVLFSLGTMGLNWQGLPDALRKSFIDGLKRVNASRRNKKSDMVLSTEELLPVVEYIMYASNHGSEMESKALPFAPQTPTSANRQKNAHSHGKFDDHRDINPRDNPRDREGSGSKGRKATSKQMNAQGVSMTVVGLSRLGAGWSLLPEELVRTLELAIVETSVDMNFAQVAATISGLSKSQWRWQSLNASTQDALIAVITRTAPKANPLDIAILLNGMGVLGMRWSDLSHDSRKAVMQGVCRVARGGDAYEIAGVVFGLGLMECTWEKMAQKVRKVLVDGILRVCGLSATSARGASVSRSALNMDATWLINGDTTQQRNRVRRYVSSPISATPSGPVPAGTANGAAAVALDVGHSMSPQAAANLAYGISLLVFDNTESSIQSELNSVHEALLGSIARIGASSFSEPEREQVLIYMHVLQTVVALDTDTVNSRSGCMLRADKRYMKPSKLQQSVVSSLAYALRRRSTAELQIENEYSAFDGAFPVDATIFEGDRPVAFIEVDGPQHYREDGELLRKDVMKEALYRRKHPHAAFTRVRFDQVNKLGSSFVGAQVANYVATVRTVRGMCCSGTEDHRDGSSAGMSGTSGMDSSQVAAICAACEEEGLAARRAERELAMALAGKQVRGSAFNSFWNTGLPLIVASEPDNS